MVRAVGAGPDRHLPVCGVLNLEGRALVASVIQHPHRVTLRRPVDSNEHVPPWDGSDTSVKRTWTGRSLTGALRRVPLCRLQVLGRPGAAVSYQPFTGDHQRPSPRPSPSPYDEDLAS